MKRNQRTVLMALFGPSFIIAEDYLGDNLPWKQFQRAVEREIDDRSGQPNHWRVESNNEDAVPILGDKRKVVPFRTSTTTNPKFNV